MIHSLSGGVLSDGGVLWFSKVDVAGTPCWYLSPHTLAAGTRVRVPFGGGSAEGEVLRTECCTPQTAPVPVRRAKHILCVLSLPAGSHTDRGENA